MPKFKQGNKSRKETPALEPKIPFSERCSTCSGTGKSGKQGTKFGTWVVTCKTCFGTGRK